MSNGNDVPHLPGQVVAERTHLQLPSFPHWIEPTVEFLRQKAIMAGACQETRSGKLMVALHEALSNAIVHGNLEISSGLKEQGDNAFAEVLARRVADPAFAERAVEVQIDCDLDRCRWMVTDQGNGFNVEKVLRRASSDDPETMLASGRGIVIMRSFLDEVNYELGGRRLVLTLKKESGAEKRVQPRVAVHQPVQVVPILPDGTVDWEAAYAAVSKNFSEGGVGLLQERLAQSERVIIGIASGREMLYVPAEVRHCRSLGGDVVELGCRFQSAAGASAEGLAKPEELARVQEAIQGLLEKFQQPLLPAGDNRRAHPRVMYTERIEVLCSGRADRVIGYARDLSKGGIAFIATGPVPLEGIVVFLPQGGGVPLRLRSQVVRCAKIQDNFFDVGAKFLELVGKG